MIINRIAIIMKTFFNKLHNYLFFGVVSLSIDFNIRKSVHIKGIKTPIYMRGRSSDLNVFRQIFKDKEYHIDTFLPPNFIPEIIIDAGANIGLAAVYFKNKYKDAKIISIEPSKDNFEILQKNIKDYPNIIAVNSAIWDKSTYLKITNTNDAAWEFVVNETTATDPEAFIATSISDLMEKYKLEKIDILKMDIEGAEKEVFSSPNYHDWLKKTKILVIEVHDFISRDTAKTVFDALYNYDYRFGNRGENLVFIFNH